MSDASVRNYPKRGHRRTTSLISKPHHILFDFPTSWSGISTPPTLETEVARGSFTPTSSAFPCLTNMIASHYPGSISGYSRRRQHSMFEWPNTPFETGGSDTSSVIASPTSRSFFAPVPGISRTSSSDTHSFISSTSDAPSHAVRIGRSEMNPILSQLERGSKFCSIAVGCATCGKPGSDYPRCGNCGEMWCSRPCRLRRGKKHVCASKAF